MMRRISSFLLCLGIITTLLAATLTANVGASETCPDGLIAYWRLDDEDGTEALDSIGNNHGTLVNDPEWTTTGQVNGALDFNGQNQIVDVGTSIASTSLNELTLEAWVFFEGTLHPIANNMIISKHTWYSDSGRVFWMGIETNKRLEAKFWYDSSNGHVHLSDPEDFPTDQWVHVAAVWNNGNAYLYRDGVLVNSASGGQPLTNDQDTEVTIGSVYGASDTYSFNGPIDEVAVWGKALSEDDILLHYTNGLIGKDYCYDPLDDSIQDLFKEIQDINLPDGSENSLLAKLNAALESIDNGDENAAINILNAFINAVQAQSGKKLTAEQANALIATAEDILNTIAIG